jgi:hypothetical protein
MQSTASGEKNRARAGQLRQWTTGAVHMAGFPGCIFLVLGKSSRLGLPSDAWDFLNLDHANMDWHYQNFIENASEVVAEGEE